MCRHELVPSRVLLAATQKLAELAESLIGTTMCHDLALAAPEALSQEASTAGQRSIPKSLFRDSEDTEPSVNIQALQALHTEPALSSTDILQATKQRPG